ncbi:MAG: protein kinase, partial [Acidobacteriia bacterium]|nr:protein kinase [Terriglobia bacterium]
TSGIVKVMDFGIAKTLGKERLTRTGMQMGTIAYMSPEQIRNEAVDARSDIYSLGVTLFEMLTGRLPFAYGSDFEMMSAHLKTPPPRLGQYCPDLPAGIEQAVLKGLEKNPAQRFQTAEQFGAALELRDAAERRVSPAPVAARPLSPPPRVASPPQHHSPVPAARLKSAVSPAAGVAHRISPAPFQPAEKRRSPLHAFLSLAFGVAVLCLLFIEGLLQESVGLLLACAVLLYFLPILIAAVLLKRNGAAVVKQNALRGWTGIGWIEAMKLALAMDK